MSRNYVNISPIRTNQVGPVLILFPDQISHILAVNWSELNSFSE